MVRYGRFWILLAVVVGFSGCDDAPTKALQQDETVPVLMVEPDQGLAPELMECLTIADCGSGMMCVSGSCVDGSAGLPGDCHAEAPCADGMVCQDGTCIPVSPPRASAAISSIPTQARAFTM